MRQHLDCDQAAVGELLAPGFAQQKAKKAGGESPGQKDRKAMAELATAARYLPEDSI